MTALDELSDKLILALQSGLCVKNNFLVKAHSRKREPTGNRTLMRILYYPPVPSHRPEGTMRCGAHTDYGTITLLLQDGLGGLEVLCSCETLRVKTRSGAWVPAPPLESAVLVNVADLLQRWTNNQLIATEHRVMMPATEHLQKLPRRSIAYFVHPDDDVMVEPLDGKGGLPPVNAEDWLNKRYKESIQY
ncbi:2-oxoglutarate-dependent dioxygenase htyE-like [Hyalella azteca]|uniref:2-oxoglutarate-dependent dioxygenase htyE-like n=1 Tax=Hyalella azteca TaxID=294128 RepID=A0A979FPW2_HYAAZ|nr:2-oxoglutarate-dependent dioxygenase htyE-like [Hyalella azteca]